MYRPRLRSPPRIAPHKHSGSAASTTKDSSSMALGSTASPSKVSPHLTPLPPLIRSRSPSPPLSQTPHRRARSITPPPQSNGTLGPGHATPPHKTWQTIKKRKWTHLTPETSQPAAPSTFTSRNRFDEFSHLFEDDMRRSDEDLTPTAGTPRAQEPRVHNPPPIYVYGVTNYQDIASYLKATLEEEQYYCKALTDETIKINVSTCDS